METSLTLEGVCKTQGAFTLDNVDLRVEAGTITGLVGANGAGKSTLIKLVMGLLAPEAGSVRLFGRDVREHGAELRARVGYVQESPTLPRHLKALELGALVGPFYRTWDPTAFKALLEAFEVPPRTPFMRLSQGNRMKLSLALALAHGPELLVLDEPTSGLDPLARRDLLDRLLEVVQDETRAVLFSTHITSDLDRVADHVAFLKDGRLVLAGAKDDLTADWVLVKGGPELLDLEPGRSAAGGRRTELGVELLCRSDGPSWPADVLVERPRMEDLLYFFGRPVDAPSLQEA